MNRALLLLLLAATAGPAQADALRCGNKLVSEGDTRAEVSNKCGDPTDVDHSTVMVQPTTWVHGRPVVVGNGMVEVVVETWLYNLGPHQFMRRVRFQDGRVVAIETLGYGYIKSGN
jgi:Protein of unknown function (DUF2845)